MGHVLPGGCRTFLVVSAKELEVLLTCSNLTAWRRSQRLPRDHGVTGGRAAPLAIRVTDPSASLCGKESEQTLCAHCVCAAKTTKFQGTTTTKEHRVYLSSFMSQKVLSQLLRPVM